MDASTRRQFVEVLIYIEERHWIIDPDMFRFDLAEIAALKQLIESGDADDGGRIAVTSRDLLLLEYALDAAGTYSNRRGQPKVDDVGDNELASLMTWAVDAHRWFFPSNEEDT
jgi:hypothetical protein